MAAYNWEFDFDPAFPVYLFRYDVPGHRDRLHWHRYCEIGLCVEGSGTFQYASKSYRSEMGDIFVTNNYETHVAVTDEPRQQFVFLIFLPSFISGSGAPGRTLSSQYLQTFQYNPPRFNNRLPASSPGAEALRRPMLEALEAYERRSEDWQMRVDILVREILCSLHGVYIRDTAPGQRVRINPKLLAAHEYINANFTQPITVEEVSKVADMYPSYFRHVFKDTFQISFKEYVTQLRLAEAQLALSATDASINHIIEDVGYSNATQFYHIFRRYTGMTPAEYRRMASATAVGAPVSSPAKEVR